MIAYTKKEADTENFSLLLLQKKEMKEKKTPERIESIIKEL